MTAAAVATVLEKTAPKHVISFSELHLVLAAQVRERLGLAGESSAVEARVRNKAETRRALRDAGLSQTKFLTTDVKGLSEATRQLTPPFVIKPTDLTGSVGVLAVHSHDQVKSYRGLFRHSRSCSIDSLQLLVEDFMEGKELSVEGISFDGQFIPFAATEKHTSGFPNFYETGHLFPSRFVEDEDRIFGYVQDVLRYLDIRTAPIHAEVKLTDKAVELIEIHTRFAGDLIPLLIERAFQVKPLGMFYDALLLNKPTAVLHPESKIAGIRFFPPCGDDGQWTLPVPTVGVRFEANFSEIGTSEWEYLRDMRAPNRRSGHVLFTTSSYERADAIMELLHSFAGDV